MVAKNIYLPNIRNQFIPDPGHIICDMDLAGADAQVVAWEANDERMKDAFRKGLKIHIRNAQDMYPDKYADMPVEQIKEEPIYKAVKVLCHGTNYGAMPPTLAVDPNVKWPVSMVDEFQNRWFSIRPGIKKWHKRTDNFLQGTQCWRCETYTVNGEVRCPNCNAKIGMTVSNKFGFRIIFKTFLDHNVRNAALAWGPQSTVAIVARKGLLRLRKYDWITTLMQVHDSLVFQFPKKFLSHMQEVEEDLNDIVVPYEDPLRIPWGVAMSDTRWGDCG